MSGMGTHSCRTVLYRYGKGNPNKHVLFGGNFMLRPPLEPSVNLVGLRLSIVLAVLRIPLGCDNLASSSPPLTKGITTGRIIESIDEGIDITHLELEPFSEDVVSGTG